MVDVDFAPLLYPLRISFKVEYLESEDCNENHGIECLDFALVVFGHCQCLTHLYAKVVIMIIEEDDDVSVRMVQSCAV